MLLYFPLFFLGAITTYTDLRYGIIKNKHLFYAVFWGLGINLYLFFTQNTTDNIHLLLNLVLGLGLSMVLYVTHSWRAGDAKLFMVYCLLVPIGKNSHIVPFNSLALFTNIFVFSFFILFFLIFLEKDAKLPIRKIIFCTAHRLFTTVFTVLCMAWVVPYILFSLFPSLENGLLYVIVLYLSYRGIDWVLSYALTGDKIGILLSLVGFLTRIHVEYSIYFWDGILATLKATAIYALIFHGISIILSANIHQSRTIRFAPLMFLGVLLSNTNFLGSFINVLQMIKK